MAGPVVVVVVVVVAFAFLFGCWRSAGTWGCAGRADALLRRVRYVVRGGMFVPRPEFLMPHM
jgi:hypothetical protein